MWIYLRRVAHHWVSFVVFAGPGALIAWLATASGAHVPLVIWVCIAFAGLGVAQHRAYRDATRERDEAVAKLSQLSLRRRTREGLALLLQGGQALEQEIAESLRTRTTSTPSTSGSWSLQQTEQYSDVDWWPRLRAWQEDVVTFLRTNLDASYEALFQSDAGISRFGHIYFNYEEGLTEVLTVLSIQLQRLAEFIARLPDS